jgi:hypothetical protein
MELEQDIELNQFIEDDDLMEEFLNDSEMRDLVEDFKEFENLHGVETHMIIEQLQDNTWYVEFKDEKQVFDNYNDVREFFLSK